MEENKRGGKRDGAGRKPMGVEKETVSIFVEKGKIWKFGTKEKLKKELYGFIESFGVQDLSKPTIEIKPYEQPQTNFSIDTTPKISQPQKGLKSYQDHMNHIATLTFPDDKTEYMEVIRAAVNLSDKEKERLITSLKF